MNEETQQAASYGEPWAEGRAGIIWSEGENRAILDQEPYEGNYWTDTGSYQYRARAIQCVNACAGIADPENAIQAAREALAAFVERFTPIEQDLIFSKRDALRKARAALAQLNNTK